MRHYCRKKQKNKNVYEIAIIKNETTLKKLLIKEDKF